MAGLTFPHKGQPYKHSGYSSSSIALSIMPRKYSQLQAAKRIYEWDGKYRDGARLIKRSQRAKCLHSCDEAWLRCVTLPGPRPVEQKLA